MMVYKTVQAIHIVQKVVHMILQLTAFVLGVVGLCAVFKFHDMASIEDVYSLHSWIGIGTISLFALQVKEIPNETNNFTNFPTTLMQSSHRPFISNLFYFSTQTVEFSHILAFSFL